MAVGRMATLSETQRLVRRSGGILSRREARLGYALVAPGLICLLLLVFYPFVFAIWISFTDRMIGRAGHFVGLANYAYLFGQPSFLASIRNTITLVVAVQLLKLGFGLGIAVLLNQQIGARKFCRGWARFPLLTPA